MKQANQVLASYLPRFNTRFAVPPAQEGTAYRPWQDTQSLDQVFCFKYPRLVAADNTISLAGRRLQLLPDHQRRSYAKARVEVHEHFDGSLAVYYADRCVATTPAPLEASKVRARGGARGTAGTDHATSAAPVVVAPNGYDAISAQEPPASQAQQPGGTPLGPTHPWRKRLLPPRSLHTRAEVS